ncbi:hypothetical protein PHMEG_00014144 [Phytophthora megakarya]|uniref:Uncharacterized protein n=1 Tax=Phytophthora megakarya TaxID=4795 RepID=A0A225W633_9STRA|nr:hypothetical protein PHMEG_00014144 [Phytophthora megakarya]
MPRNRRLHGGFQASCISKALSFLSELEEEDTASSRDTEGHKKARSPPDSSADISPPAKKSRSPPAPTLNDGCIDDDMGGDMAAEAYNEDTKSDTGLSASVVDDVPTSSSAVEVVDLTSDDFVTLPPEKDSSPFSCPVVSFFPCKDGRPRRSTCVSSELRMRENIEKELADDDFMLGLVNERSAAQVTGSVHVPSSMTRQAVISNIVVDSSLADADLSASWIEELFVEAEESTPVESAGQGSVGIEAVPPESTEATDAPSKDSFSFVPVKTATSGSSSGATEDSATPAGVEAPAHDVEQPPSDICSHPFKILVSVRY